MLATRLAVLRPAGAIDGTEAEIGICQTKSGRRLRPVGKTGAKAEISEPALRVTNSSISIAVAGCSTTTPITSCLAFAARFAINASPSSLLKSADNVTGAGFFKKNNLMTFYFLVEVTHTIRPTTPIASSSITNATNKKITSLILKALGAATPVSFHTLTSPATARQICSSVAKIATLRSHRPNHAPMRYESNRDRRCSAAAKR
jgi:hypothetical protein